ncbi:MAG: hypothetical protein ACOYBC_01660 [Bilifractor sp.]|jgi:hypothetical protein
MFSIILFLLAIWLFFKFIGLIFRLSWGVMKIGFSILAILLWPLSFLLLLSMGFAVVAIPVIIVCGLIDLVGKGISG